MIHISPDEVVILYAIEVLYLQNISGSWPYVIIHPPYPGAPRKTAVWQGLKRSIRMSMKQVQAR